MPRRLVALIAVLWVAVSTLAVAPPARPPVGASVAGPEKDGVRIRCELPGDLHRANTSSRGLGNCVFTSIHHSAVYQNTPALQEFPKWLIAKGIPGGGYPSKVDDLIPKLCQERNLPVPDYVQAEGADLGVIDLALKTGRMASVTYGISPTGRYGGRRIAHMVNCVHADGTHYVILDNNYPGSDKYEWLSRAEMQRSYTIVGGGWTFVLLTSPPPPPVRKPMIGRAAPAAPVLPPPAPPVLFGAGEPVPPVPDSDNYGLDPSRIGEGRYSLNGREVTREQALEAMGKGTLVDDSAKLRLTVVLPDAERQAACKAVASEQLVKELCLVQCYPPDHWSVKGRQSGVWLQKADGEVLLHTAGLDMVRLLRKLRNEPDPEPPAPPSPGPGPAPGPIGPDWWRQVPWQAWGVAGGVVLVLLLLAVRKQ